MLSYQHIYHAGCLADVHKHLLLVHVLQEIVKSPEGITYIETHAGRGVYDLSSAESRKTGEAKEGILKLLAANRIHGTYQTLIQQTKAIYGKHAYPGSPLLAKILLRKIDKLYLHEMHPREYEALQNLESRNTFIQKADGYTGCMLLPLSGSRQGLVLVDPSYEVKTEYEQAAYFIQDLHEKWPEAIILLWYPMLKNRLFEEMAAYLDKQAFPKYMRHEVLFADPRKTRGMFGSGMIGVNMPPMKLDDMSKLFNL